MLEEHWRSPGRCDSERPLRAWLAIAEAATWAMPQSTKATFGNASVLRGGRVVLNIGGNKYRPICAINYRVGVVVVRFIGTYAEYDRVDALTI
ncbi:MAG: type II toxin-antitoxin system HigB family toxin [Alphaproteobacteria bacterium]|nr:type II toxin-antitoxin system HigB family toxin [Alphaproteobacteria bacterium]